MSGLLERIARHRRASASRRLGPGSDSGAPHVEDAQGSNGDHRSAVGFNGSPAPTAPEIVRSGDVAAAGVESAVDAPTPVDGEPTPLEADTPVDDEPTPLESDTPVDDAPTPLEADAPVDDAPTPLEADAPVDDAPTPLESETPVDDAPAVAGTLPGLDPDQVVLWPEVEPGMTGALYDRAALDPPATGPEINGAVTGLKPPNGAGPAEPGRRPVERQPEPEPESWPTPNPGLVERGRMRRRARYLRQLREMQLRDIGGFVLELHRFGRERPDLVQEKVSEAALIDGELRALERALGTAQPRRELRVAGIGGACNRCGTVHGSADRFCSSCGEPLAATRRSANPETLDR